MLTALGTLDQRVTRPRCRGRRLPDEAVRLHRAAGPAPRARAPWPDLGLTRLWASAISSSTRCASKWSSASGRRTLSAREYALLAYLVREAGTVLTRRQILDAVWGADPDVYSNVVDLYVHYLRRKLGSLGRRGALQTVRGVGYVLRPVDDR